MITWKVNTFKIDTFNKEILFVKKMKCQKTGKSLCSKKANIPNFEKTV